MSYSLQTPCYYCNKQKTCKDAEKIQKGINEIHQSTDGSHQGSGSVILTCMKIDSSVK